MVQRAISSSSGLPISRERILTMNRTEQISSALNRSTIPLLSTCILNEEELHKGFHYVLFPGVFEKGVKGSFRNSLLVNYMSFITSDTVKELQRMGGGWLASTNLDFEDDEFEVNTFVSSFEQLPVVFTGVSKNGSIEYFCLRNQISCYLPSRTSFTDGTFMTELERVGHVIPNENFMKMFLKKMEFSFPSTTVDVFNDPSLQKALEQGMGDFQILSNILTLYSYLRLDSRYLLCIRKNNFQLETHVMHQEYNNTLKETLVKAQEINHSPEELRAMYDSLLQMRKELLAMLPSSFFICYESLDREQVSKLIFLSSLLNIPTVVHSNNFYFYNR